MKLKSLLTALALTATTLGALAADAVIDVQNAWARATVKGQMATGAFMTITARNNGKLVGLSSPVAGVVQLHEMKMDSGVMSMAELKDGLKLPAGKAVTLKPGGYHIMMMDLKAPLAKDSTLPLTLVFQDDKGLKTNVELTLPVKTAAPAHTDAPMQHMHGTEPAAK